MPFIFHSKKQSIFERKLNDEEESENLIFGTRTSKKQISPAKNTFTLCKQHPFRKWNQPREEIINSVPCLENSWSREIVKQQMPSNEYSQKARKSETIENEKKKSSISSNQNKQDLRVFPNVVSEIQRIHKQKRNGLENQMKKQQVLRYIRQQTNPKERLKYVIDENPGPGSYNIPLEQNLKTTVLYSNSTYHRSLPKPQRNQLEALLLSIQKKFPGRQEKNLMSYCHYKNQNSASFKSSILKKDSFLKKNRTLLSMLFSKNNSKNKENQSETTCESRMASITANQLFEDGYEKNEETSPSPFSYDPNLDFSQVKSGKKTKPFLSGSPKNSSYIEHNFAPGPGSYTQVQTEKQSVFDQNQKKKPNKFERYDEVSQNVCAFSTGVPRELHFDTEKLCQQEFYYSPKNSMSEIAQMRILQGSRSNKSQFGSSLEKSSKDEILEDDPYKYCFSKTKFASNPINCPSLTFKEKRELFVPIKDTVPANKYHDTTNTIYKSTEKQLFKKLLQSKYQDEVLLLKEKKKNMESVLIQENHKSIDIKTTQKKYQKLNIDKYKEFLWKMKMIQKENISFGYNKASPLKRSIEPRKELDLYYNTGPGWEIKSFNKEYGYEVLQQ